MKMLGLAPPKQPDPVAMQDEEAVMEAKRKAAADAVKRGGRASTILTDETKLGG